MWKPRHTTESLSFSHSQESQPITQAIPEIEIAPRAAIPTGHQSTIGKDLIIEGKIIGSDPIESLYIEGTVKGSINLPFSRVTIGIKGLVTAAIEARDVVVMGTINGDITASVRADIRAKACVTGKVSAPRICIEDGASIHGQLEVLAAAPEELPRPEPTPSEIETLKLIRIRPQVRSLQIQPTLHTA